MPDGVPFAFCWIGEKKENRGDDPFLPPSLGDERQATAMKKVLIVLGSLLGLLGIAVFAFWFVALRAPEPQEVCDNVSGIMKKEVGTIPKGFQEDCLKRMQPPEFGRVPWVKQMKCLRDANSSKDIEACESKG